MTNRTEKLKNLIGNMKKTKDFSWLSDVQVKKANFTTRDKDEVGPTKNIRYTYSIRAKINEDRDNPVKGFEVFIKNLNATNTKYICIHQMRDIDDYDYRIFTDPDINELIGVLKFSYKIDK